MPALRDYLFYEEPGITLYCGDCREVLPLLERSDVLCVDPPYLGMKGGLSIARPGVAALRVPSVSVGTPWAGDLKWIEPALDATEMGAFVFCSFHFVADVPPLIAAVPPFLDAKPIALLTWYKRNSPIAIHNVPRYTTEFIWAFKRRPGLKWRNLKTTMLDIPGLQAGCMAVEREVDGDGRAAHPTQKPCSLIEALLSVGGESVLDPFCGTGTTLLAAKNLNRRAIGIEISPEYCTIAVKRLWQEVLPLS